MPAPEFLDLGPDRRLAYHRIEATAQGKERPGVVFLGGLKSDMEGTKALHLEAWARRAGRAFLRFDYRGHGQSSARFEDGSISDWADDAAEMLMRHTSGPQILVGSSMGGWIGLLLMKRMPERLAGFVGIAAAPDFTPSMRAEMDAAAKDEMARTGKWARPSDYEDGPYIITRHFLDDGDRNRVLTAPLTAPCPVRLFQGTADTAVPVSVADRLFAHLDGDDVHLTLVKDADHRFSEPGQLALVEAAVEGL